MDKGQGIREKTKVDVDTEDQLLSNFHQNFVLWVEFGYIFLNWFELIEMVELDKDNMNSVSK